MINEDKFYYVLLREKENGKINVKEKDIEIIPNYKLKDSPDFVLKIKLELLLLSETFDIEIPIPIELEKVGLEEALADLEKFIEREKYVLILPMFIVSEKGILKNKINGKFATTFKLKQIPYRLVR